MTLRARLWRVAATLLSAAAFHLSTGLGEAWLLAWIAPLPVLVVAYRSPARAAAASAFLAYLLGSLNLYSYLAALMPAAALAVTLVGPAAAFAGAVLGARISVVRFNPWIGVLAFPAAWTTWEWLVSVASPHGTGGSLAYSQADVLPVLQVASVAGFLGITFLLILVPSGLAAAWHFWPRRSEAVTALAVSSGILLASLAYGWARLGQAAAAPAVRVGLAVTDTTVRYFNTEKHEEALPVVQAYAGRAARLASMGAKIIVLPEKFVGVAPAYKDEVLRILSEAARANSVTLVAGLNLVGINPRRNVAVVFGPDGKIVAEYDKIHLVPGLEGRYAVGEKPALLSAAGASCGVTICKDMDFAEWSRAYAKAGAGLLLVPAWDFVRDARLHCRMAVMRGIEGGFALVRTAQEGLVTVSDDRGRILAEQTSWSSPEVLIVADVAPGAGGTLYRIAGNWLGWCGLALLVWILTRALRYSS